MLVAAFLAGGWFPVVGALRGWLRGLCGPVAGVVLWDGTELPVALAGLKQFGVGGVSDPSQ